MSMLSLLQKANKFCPTTQFWVKYRILVNLSYAIARKTEEVKEIFAVGEVKSVTK